MSKLAKILGGRKAKAVGAGFETAVLTQALREGLFPIKWPDGCRRIPGPMKMIPVKTLFDFTIFGDSKMICIDTKTFEKNTLTKGDLVEHQINALATIQERGFVSGYLVYFRKLNQISFFSAKTLLILFKEGGSLRSENGYILGGLFDFKLITLIGLSNQCNKIL